MRAGTGRWRTGGETSTKVREARRESMKLKTASFGVMTCISVRLSPLHNLTLWHLEPGPSFRNVSADTRNHSLHRVRCDPDTEVSAFANLAPVWLKLLSRTLPPIPYLRLHHDYLPYRLQSFTISLIYLETEYTWAQIRVIIECNSSNLNATGRSTN